jgi:hypothetical protein
MKFSIALSLLLLSAHAFAGFDGLMFSCAKVSGSSEMPAHGTLYPQKVGQIELDFEDDGSPDVGDYYRSSVMKSMGAKSQFSGFAEFNKATNEQVTTINAVVTLDSVLLSDINASGMMILDAGSNGKAAYKCSSEAGD